ncbi:hypothetical protein N0V95_004018 [Ascochyta clinopodiicola]|nr:hypothetical protein N0V95_004018 [Ascochyta clinopodiicola]
MPPNTRLPTVEFRSLLLPPTRVRLGSLNSFCRPQCASTPLHGRPPAGTCLVQRRPLYLYKTARAKTLLGMHKILDFELYKLAPPTASNHRVTLVESVKRPNKTVKEDVTFEELYEKHVSPGRFLHMVEGVDKRLADNFHKMRETNFPSKRRSYTIVEARLSDENKSKSNTSKAHPENLHEVSKAIKGAPLLLSSPPAYTTMVLNRSYNFIASGALVEFTIRAFRLASDEVYRHEGLDIQRWLHEHFPHLRPDFLLKSMPKGTEYIVEPVTNGSVIQFVLGKRPGWMRGKDLTKRLFSIRREVEDNLPKNEVLLASRWFGLFLERDGKRKLHRVGNLGNTDTDSKGGDHI